MGLNNKEKRTRRKKRIRKYVFGTAIKPRLSVYRSNKEIYAQLINDISKTTLVSASSRDKSLSNFKGKKTEKSFIVGEILANYAKKLNIQSIVFDRNGFIYHGRIKALAEGARKGGLKF